MNRPFRIDRWRVDPDTCRIRRGDEEIKLEPKAMTVLLCLARHAGDVLSRDQLEAMAWEGVVVGYDSLASSIIKLRRAFGDDPKNPRVIETVPKRGYRLIAPVGPAEPETPTALATARPSRKAIAVPAAVAAALAAIILVAVLALIRAEKPAPDSDRRSIAVLPFRNLSADPSQEYFSDGITADLITDLSKISSLGVIARNSVFTYKGLDVDVRRLRDELGVTYVLEGSVRKDGNRVRISARLIDTRNGHNLWAERFDGELGGIFALQDEVTDRIVSSLALHLTDSERVTLDHEYTRSVAAYDEFLHGWQSFWNLSRDSNHTARDHFLKAIELDPEFARAYANLALTYGYDYTNAWHEDPEYALELARRYAQKAVELDPDLPQVHWVKSLVHVIGREYQAAIDEAQLTLRQNPNYADGYGVLADALNYAGKPRQALEVMEKAMRLDPHHPHIYLTIRGEIHFNLRDYAAAIDDFEAALARNPEAQEARLWLAAAYAHTGRVDDAGWQLDHIRYTGTRLTLDYVERIVPFNDPAQRKHLLDGLYRAGLEEQ